MLRRMLILCYTVFYILNIVSICSSNVPKNYGEFTLRLSVVTMCKGPKKSDCSNNSVNLVNGTSMRLYMDVKKNVIPTRGKISIMLNGQHVVRLQMKTPCNHLFLKPVFQKLINITQDCEFKKGNYSFNLDLESIVQTYYGGMFYYGNITFKSLLWADDCNFFCMVEQVTLSPKKPTTLSNNNTRKL